MPYATSSMARLDLPAVAGDGTSAVAVMRSGAEMLVSQLIRAGVRTLFAYPGTSELPLCEAAAASGRVSVVNSRGDREAVFMAAGGNLLSPGSCAAIVHGARGLTNALGAVADVRRSEIPLLCIVGMPSTESAAYLPPHGELDLLGPAGAFAAGAFDCSPFPRDPAGFATAASSALSRLQYPPFGPVLLGVPQDVLSLATMDPREPDTTGTARTVPAASSIAEAAARICESRRPIILIDDYSLRTPTAECHIARLSERIDAPVMQVWYQRGPMLFQQLRPERVPMYLGLFDPANYGHRALLDNADLLITIEDRNMYPRVVGDLPRCAKIAITSNQAATIKNGYLAEGDVLLVGETVPTLDLLVQELGRVAPRSLINRIDILTGAQDNRAKSSRSARALVTAIGLALTSVKGTVVVDDSQMLGGVIARNYRHLPLDTRVFGSHGGFVGSGLPTAVGMAIANAETPVLCVLGDQGYTNAIQALTAAAEAGSSAVVLVCNNGSSVSLRKQASAEGFAISASATSFLTNSGAFDYVAAAQGFGVPARRIIWPRMEPARGFGEAADALSTVLADALAARRPYLVEVVTPGSDEFWSGVWATHGQEPNGASIDLPEEPGE